MVAKMQIFHSADYQVVTSLEFKSLIYSDLTNRALVVRKFFASCTN